ncbi:MAG: tRNA adenosine(34) deaminase TadA [Wenzhouxiangella sp.]
MENCPIQPQDQHWMSQAMILARRAEALGEVPVGAVVVHDGKIVGAGFNRLISDNDPTAHAEIIALRAAGRQLGNYRLPEATLYVTLEPCSMCAGAIISARLERVVYATSDPRTGAAGSVFQVLDNPQLNHRCRVTTGVQTEQAAEMLRAFFRARRR